MLTAKQTERIEREAYLPEHLPGYVCAISGAEPLWFEDYLAYARQDVLIFIGYPLGVPFGSQALEATLAAAIRQCRPGLVSLIAPTLPASLDKALPPDWYYRLDLAAVVASQKTRNMIRRSGRELSVSIGRQWGPDHGRLVEAFLQRRPVDEAGRSIFAGIERYLAASPTARIFEARNGAGQLVAFDIAEFGSCNYAFYMFNIPNADRYVPGASDLLLARVIEQAAGEGKRYINLGLGISPGVAAFKTKWGGVPFVPHAFHQYHPAPKGLLEMLLRWL
jgi:hypothetical protein